jgi:hypothetical protein
MPISDYKYDVFFSYRRDKLVQGWITEVVSRLRFWLTQELSVPEATLFCDQDSIEVGDRWPESLRSALASSRCMVAIWSPSYFQSAWCVSEWRSFLAREKQLSLSAHGLIAPVRYHDGEHFPVEASQVQWADFSEYTSTIAAFWNTSRAVEFEDRIKEFAGSVAALVRKAPAFRTDWPIVDAQPSLPPAVALRRL